jgi:hypothetical protein
MTLSHEQLIHQFYTSFQVKDWKGMQSVYHPDAVFNDPAFTHLSSKEVKAMWHMLVAGSTDLKVMYDHVRVDGDQGHCQWQAWYTFSKTKRPVHNKISASFLFKDGLIIQHHDTFNLWKWSQMALGPVGLLLGWSPWMGHKVKAMARQNLDSFIQKNPNYQEN